MSKWYLLYEGQRVGPMTKENLLAYKPTKDTQVWCEGMEQWQPIYTIPELMEMISGGVPQPVVKPTPGVQPPVTPLTAQSSGKDKIVAGILALLLGYLGIQYFYVGKPVGGILTILLCIVTCGLWDILVFIQGIMMLCMSQEDFDRKFVYSNSTLPLF